jgi:hypothetical protein
MSYSKLTLKDLQRDFNLEATFQENLFTKITPRNASEWLKTGLFLGVELALQQDTEKARSELIISPVFVELRTQAEKKISIFSGVEFNVDKKLRLTGECDFLISRSAYQMLLSAPIIVAVEAKRQDFEKGYAQCIAEMIAVRIFNEREGNPTERVYGTVTTGDVWRFLMLENNHAFIETVSFDIREDLERILGILWAMTFDEVKKY